MASGSSPLLPRAAGTTQTIENTAEHVRLEIRAHTNEVGAGNFDGDHVADTGSGRRRSDAVGLQTNRYRDQPRPGLWWRRRRNRFDLRPITLTPAENLVCVDVVAPRDNRNRRTRRQRCRHDLPLQRLRPSLVSSPPAICVHICFCGHIHIPAASVRRRDSRRRAAPTRRCSAEAYEAINAEDKLKRLYKLIEYGVAEMDDLLKDRITALKTDRAGHAKRWLAPSAT